MQSESSDKIRQCTLRLMHCLAAFCHASPFFSIKWLDYFLKREGLCRSKDAQLLNLALPIINSVEIIQFYHYENFFMLHPMASAANFAVLTLNSLHAQ